MLNAGQAGFVNAPVTKSAVVAVVTTTILASISGGHGRLSLNPVAALGGEPWRVVTHNVPFDTPGELLFGTVLLYFFRQTERQMGSSRFFAFLVAACTLYTAALVGLAIALRALSVAAPEPASGPYALLGALIVHFFFDTPKIYSFTILHSVLLSDKSFPYLLYLQLLISGMPHSLLVSSASVLTGLVLRIPFLSDRLHTPQPLVRLGTQALLPLLDTAPRRRRRGARRGARGGAHAQPAQDPGIVALTSMGFTREQAVAALAQAGGDVQRATELLLAS